MASVAPEWLLGFLAEQSKRLHEEVDVHCAALRRSIDAACGPAQADVLMLRMQSEQPLSGQLSHIPDSCSVSALPEDTSLHDDICQSYDTRAETTASANSGANSGNSQHSVKVRNSLRNVQRVAETLTVASANSGASGHSVNMRNSLGSLQRVTETPTVANANSETCQHSVNMRSSRGSLKSGAATPMGSLESRKVDKKAQEFQDLMTRTSSLKKIPINANLAHKMHGWFDKATGICILANTVVMFLQMQVLGQKADASLGHAAEVWKHAEFAFRILDNCFCAFFIAEIILRFCHRRTKFFSSGFDLLDGIVVMLMALDTFVMTTLDGEGYPMNMSFLRVLNFFRMIRAMRIVRTIGHFRQLRILWKTIAASLWSITYSMIVMLVFLVMLALFLTQTLHSYIIDDSAELEHRQWVNMMYGDGVKSVWTVFEMTFSGCWPNYVRPLVEKVSWLYTFVFAIYVCIVIFAMTRIVAALFLKETLQQASEDADLVVREREANNRHIEKDLLALFRAADTDGDGFLTEDEMCKVFSNARMKLWLGRLGIDASEPQVLFRQLDATCTNAIPVEAFVYGIKRLKGEARAQDLVPVTNDCKRILLYCEQMRRSFAQMEHCWNHTLEREKTYDI